MKEQYTNHLEKQNSLYLQQHAHNPVNWYPWSEEAWTRAKNENKLVLVSIGYSSCHWCHVMEHESFEDTAVARIMNENYICIKVDREERPDIDQIYMNAVQLMTGSGGWPLNCFTLPDGRPVYGGTYFPNATWRDVLQKLNDFYKSDPKKASEYADELTKGINEPELISTRDKTLSFQKSELEKSVNSWKKYFDNIEGGPARAPKFPLPDNYLFLMEYAVQFHDNDILDHVKLTLRKMAYGGIYDQLAGGFARYSTDTLWKVPHFEKMLYDNAQLVSLYSEAFKLTKDKTYQSVVDETLKFLKNEMSDCKGSYYSAIDADSEGEEGKYYVWTTDEILKTDLPDVGNAKGYDVFNDYYNVNSNGYWENKNYILLRKKSNAEVESKFNISESEFQEFLKQSKEKLLDVRKEREAPGLDKKVITSWNALQISALCSAFEAFSNNSYKEEAINIGKNILSNSVSSKGNLLHVASSNVNSIEGFLDDYAFTISAFIDLYKITFDEKWLLDAKKFADDAILNFHDGGDNFFWYTSKNSSALIARKKEITDNVIPASNSQMAKALFILSDYFDQKNYLDISTAMLNGIHENIIRYPSSYANWAGLLLNHLMPFSEIVIAGKDADKLRTELSKNYLPSTILAGSCNSKSNLSLLENRFASDKTLIYVCTSRTCKLPVENVQDALLLLKNNAENNSDKLNSSR